MRPFQMLAQLMVVILPLAGAFIQSVRPGFATSRGGRCRDAWSTNVQMVSTATEIDATAQLIEQARSILKTATTTNYQEPTDVLAAIRVLELTFLMGRVGDTERVITPTELPVGNWEMALSVNTDEIAYSDLRRVQTIEDNGKWTLKCFSGDSAIAQFSGPYDFHSERARFGFGLSKVQVGWLNIPILLPFEKTFGGIEMSFDVLDAFDNIVVVKTGGQWGETTEETAQAKELSMALQEGLPEEDKLSYLLRMNGGGNFDKGFGTIIFAREGTISPTYSPSNE